MSRNEIVLKKKGFNTRKTKAMQWFFLDFLSLYDYSNDSALFFTASY